NLGAAGGKNRLMASAVGDVILVLDDDTALPGRNSLRDMASAFDKKFIRESNAAIIQPRVVYFDTKEIQRSAFPYRGKAVRPEAGLFLTSYFVGGACLIKREALRQVGLYPEHFFIYMEEYDLSYRILDAGYSIAYDGTITIEHKETPQARLTD